MPFGATWMDAVMIILSEVGERQIPYHLYVESLKKDTNELITKQIDKLTWKKLPEGDGEG